ncbi:helix-turn-helix domain-containing protein [Hymenobacter nivis]|nr:helix-turn-helix transcriptional regulator [Hymenobacter nivis]
MAEQADSSQVKQRLQEDYRLRFREGRKAAGFSQGAVGQAVGISTQAVGQFELGAQRLDLENFVAACDAMHLNVRWVLKGLGEMFEGSRPVPSKAKGRPARKR